MRTAVAAIVVALALSGAAARKPRPPYPKNAVAFGGHHYLLVDQVKHLSWEGALQACERDGAHLVVVTSEAEAKFIAELSRGRYMFLGATDRAGEGQWAWIDGSPMISSKLIRFWMKT